MSLRPGMWATYATHLRALVHLEAQIGDHSAVELLKRQLMHLYQQHVSQAKCRGLISAVQVLAELKWIQALVAPWHLRMCKAPSRNLDDNRSCRSLKVLVSYSKGLRDGLAVLSFKILFQESETVTLSRGALRDTPHGGCRWLETHPLRRWFARNEKELRCHAWRRGRAALFNHFGAPLVMIMARGQWSSKVVAWQYCTPPPEFHGT